MVKNRSGRKDVCQEPVVAVDGNADVLSRLSIGRVRNYKYGRVGALTADQRAAYVPRRCIERHPLRQWREVGVRAYGIGVGRRATASGNRAAGIRRALGSAGARSGRYRQWTTGRGYSYFCRGCGRARGIGGSQGVGGRRGWAHAR